MAMHVRSRVVRVRHVIVWNIREIHVWTEVSGQGIIWQGT
jgi:hypothetical protein